MNEEAIKIMVNIRQKSNQILKAVGKLLPNGKIRTEKPI